MEHDSTLALFAGLLSPKSKKIVNRSPTGGFCRESWGRSDDSPTMNTAHSNAEQRIGVFRATLDARRSLPAPAAQRALRLAAGATLQEIADAVGVTNQAVSLWEKGKRVPRGEKLRRYVEVLDLLRGGAA